MEEEGGKKNGKKKEEDHQLYAARLQPNIEKRSNFFSRITCMFMTPFMLMGWKKTLTAEDMFQPLDEHQSAAATHQLREQWNIELRTAEEQSRQPSLRKAITRTYGMTILKIGFLLFIEEMVHLAQPVCMGRLISFFKIDSPLTYRDAYIAAAGLVTASLISISIHHPYFYAVQKIGMGVKCAVSGLVVEKGVRLSSSALHQTTVGSIVNILSTDVAKFDTGFIFMHYMWVGPILLFSYIAIIWQFIGVSSLAGFAVILLLLPFQGFLGKSMGKFRRTTAQRADKRISIMSEILNGIRVIKMYAWEEAFSAIIDKLRAHEMESVRAYGLVQSGMLGLFWSTGKLVILAAALSFVHLGNTLAADNIFVAAALFNAIRLPITLYLPFSFHCLADMLVAIERIQKVLLLDEFNQGPRKALTNGEEKKIEQLNGNAVKNGTTEKGGDLSEKLLLAVERVEIPMEEEWATVKLERTERPIVELKGFSATWETSEDHDKKEKAAKEGEEKEGEDDSDKTSTQSIRAVEDINLKAERGQLVAVIGPVGCGKSSLLASILRETRRLTGTVRIEGRVAYCSQDAWIFSGTLRENVLFGSTFDEERYRRAMELSALSTDLQQLQRGDATIVGDRGTSLSGGQKARVALARALYRDADIYLLDDPLSAVDAAVGRFIYDKCISQGLRDKVVILVTHQVQFVDSADHLVVMKGGRIVVQGSPEQVWKEHPDDLSHIIKETKKSYRRRASSDKATTPRRSRSEAGGSRDAESGDEEDLGENDGLLEENSEEEVDKEKEKTGKLAGGDEEESAEGSVPWSVYWAYMKAMTSRRPLLVGPIVFIVVVTQFWFLIVDWWMNKWTDASEHAARNNETHREWREEVNIVGKQVLVSSSEFENWYTGITICLLFFAIGRCLWFRLLEVDASRHLHQKMFDAIVHTSIEFFDKNPIGRILNRFSKDVSTMDDMISMVFFEFVAGMMNFLTLVGMIFFINPWVMVPTLPLVLVFTFLREVYLATSRDVKRLEATSRSPLYSHISALMNGLITIRAFGCEKTVLEKYHQMQDVNVASFYLSLVTSRWFAVVIDWIVIVFLTVVAFLAIYVKDILTSSEVALMLVYSVQLTGFFSWIMRQSAELQNGMVSIERIVNYAKLPPEEKMPVLAVKGKEKKKGKMARDPSEELSGGVPTWPSQGHLEMREIWMRYGEGGDYVLRGISVDVQPGEKIGIVGRTGAGKSSLLRALFRLNQPERGQMIIDDVDTATVPLRALRKSIGIIPQEPVLFVGSVRKNLDPFEEYSDEELWTALDLVELRTVVSEMGEGLESPVQEGGANWSVGQRQLLCLARALLRRTMILVIDEATANVDNNTDALIQRTLRTSFADATVLTIAHRLHTIMDSSRVLVLDHGEVRQFDKPFILLQDNGGIFSQLVRETGRANEVSLREMAKSAFEASLGEKPPPTVRTGRM